jgi:hypothetical protein
MTGPIAAAGGSVGITGLGYTGTLTVGQTGDNLKYGYSNGGIGSLSPVDPLIVKGFTLSRLWHDASSGAYDATVVFEGSFLSQGEVFSQVVINDWQSNTRTYVAASAANFSTNVSVATWNFGNGASPLYLASQQGQQHPYEWTEA